MACELSIFDSTTQELFGLNNASYDHESDIGLGMPNFSDTDTDSSEQIDDELSRRSSSPLSDIELVSYLTGSAKKAKNIEPASRSIPTTTSILDVAIDSVDLHNTQKGVTVKKPASKHTTYIAKCPTQNATVQSAKGSVNGDVCMTRNAIAARENRQRKKDYISGLEKNVKELSTENNILKSKLKNVSIDVQSLMMEVKYLKSVLANQSTLSSLLKNISDVPGVQFTKSQSIDDLDYTSDDDVPLVQITSSQGNTKKGTKRAASSTFLDKNKNKCQKIDHDYASTTSTESTLQPARRPPVKTAKKPGLEVISRSSDSGVCLHVSNNKVSLEFCGHCNQKATPVKH